MGGTGVLLSPPPGRSPALQPVPAAGFQRGLNHLVRQAVDGRPAGAAVLRVGGEAVRLDGPVVFALQCLDDGGQRDAALQGFRAGLVAVRQQHGQDLAAARAGAGESGGFVCHRLF